jgi:hypothetical protein
MILVKKHCRNDLFNNYAKGKHNASAEFVPTPGDFRTQIRFCQKGPVVNFQEVAELACFFYILSCN